MLTVIVPAFDLVQELMTFDHVFGFLSNGVRDVIMEAVFSASYDVRAVKSATELNFVNPTVVKSQAQERIITLYNEYLFDLGAEAAIEGLLPKAMEIENIVALVETEVLHVLVGILNTDRFIIQQGNFTWLPGKMDFALTVLTMSPLS